MVLAAVNTVLLGTTRFAALANTTMSTPLKPEPSDRLKRLVKAPIRASLRHLPDPLDIAIFTMRQYRRVFGHYPHLVFPNQDPPDPLETAIFIMQDYLRVHRKYPNILFPKTFTEKVQVRKIFDRRARLSMWADKYAVREYVKDKIGTEILPVLYHATLDPSDIPFDRLPKKYVVKASHGCGWLQVVTDGDAVNQDELIEQCRSWMSTNYFDLGKEWVYKNITPRILVEEFLDPGTGTLPFDYKVFVFGGKARIIQVNVDRDMDHRQNFYDTHWNRLDFHSRTPNSDADIARPNSLETMIEYAQILSDNVDFVRVDFYEVRNKVYFGEMTNTPANGFYIFSPPSWDKTLGGFWKIRMRKPANPEPVRPSSQ